MRLRHTLAVGFVSAIGLYGQSDAWGEASVSIDSATLTVAVSNATEFGLVSGPLPLTASIPTDSANCPASGEVTLSNAGGGVAVDILGSLANMGQPQCRLAWVVTGVTGEAELVVQVPAAGFSVVPLLFSLQTQALTGAPVEEHIVLTGEMAQSALIPDLLNLGTGIFTAIGTGTVLEPQSVRRASQIRDLLPGDVVRLRSTTFEGFYRLLSGESVVVDQRILGQALRD